MLLLPEVTRALTNMAQMAGRRLDEERLDAMSRRWHQAIRYAPDDVFRRSVLFWLDEDKFPSLNQFRDTLRKYTPDPPPDPSLSDWCSQCGTHYWFAGFERADGRVLPRVRCRCKQVGVGWETEAARAWVEDDPKLIHAGYVPPAEAQP